MSDIIAINEQEMNDLITKLGDYRKSISKSFEDMADIFESLSTCVVGDVGTDINTKAAEIDANNPVVLANLQSYITDFVTVKGNFLNKQSVIKTKEVEDDNVREEEIIHVNKT